MKKAKLDEHNGREAFRLYQLALHQKWDERMWTRLDTRKRRAWSAMASEMIAHILENEPKPVRMRKAK